MSLFRPRLFAYPMAIFIAQIGCDSITPGDTYEPGSKGTGAELERFLEDRQTIFGKDGTSLFGDDPPPSSGGDIGVNAFLWRASLDTISFMPVNSADPFGGVIITDWHSSAEAPNERFKLNIYILGRALRADGIRVAVFRQVFNRNGLWVDAEIPQKNKTKIEDAILTRARQLRSAALLQKKN